MPSDPGPLLPPLASTRIRHTATVTAQEKYLPLVLGHTEIRKGKLLDFMLLIINVYLSFVHFSVIYPSIIIYHLFIALPKLLFVTVTDLLNFFLICLMFIYLLFVHYLFILLQFIILPIIYLFSIYPSSLYLSLFVWLLWYMSASIDLSFHSYFLVPESFYSKHYSYILCLCIIHWSIHYLQIILNILSYLYYTHQPTWKCWVKIAI